MRKIVVNLDSETERLKHFQRYNIDAIRLCPVSLLDDELNEVYNRVQKANKTEQTRKKEISNLLTFRNIIRQAKEDGIKQVLRLEDDVEMIGDMDSVIEQIQTLPEDFAFCHLGTYFRETKNGILTKYNKSFLEIGSGIRTWGLHAMVFNSYIFDKILEDFKDDEVYKRTLDYYMQMNIAGKYRCFCAYPIIALQKEEFVKNSMHKLRFNQRLYEESERNIKKMLDE